MQQSFRDTKNKAFQFVKDYEDAFKENSESQSFLNDFFAVFDVDRRRVATFEKPVKTDDKGAKRIDLLWSGVLLVEMKSTGKDLDKAYRQGVGYFKGLKDNELPRYVMVCDLNRFRLYDLIDNKDYNFELNQLTDNLHLFDFMQGGEVEDITEFDLNQKAAELLGQLHDDLAQSGYPDHDLQVFMVRILFCLFAEDTGVFNRHQFTKYLLKFTDESGIDTDMHLQKLFQTFNKDVDSRNKNLADELNAFPYVNGGLFEESIEMPSFIQEMRDVLIECCFFNWKDISPAIFGSLFQSIMDKETRRNLGAHYTSEKNILKLIEPLFLDDLKAQFKSIYRFKQTNRRNKALIDLMQQLQNLKFLDPACGCGNFLIITYRELRILELKILQAQQKDASQMHIGIEIEPQIKLNNFYGIEIDEWPVRIAEVAMWLTQHQMNVEFAKAFGTEPDLLPLIQHANIRHANALELDWGEVVATDKLNYIIGNPPFVDRKGRNPKQNESHKLILEKLKGYGNIDFVSNWFYKSALFTQNTTIETALVSTNSITMGEQVGTLWQPMLEMGIKINFAHRTFSWHNDATGNAAVHCVIIGFSHQDRNKKYLFDYVNLNGEPTKNIVDCISPYLVNAKGVLIKNRTLSITNSLPIQSGNMSNDGGNLIISEKEKVLYLTDYPELKNWIRPYMGGKEFINGGSRYCLWLTDIGARDLSLLMKIPIIKDRVNNVKILRSSSKRKATRRHADTPWLFTEIRQPKSCDYIFIPQLSSERRDYLPIGFLSSLTIPAAPHFIIRNAGLYEFGILTSQMHMDWMRTVAGRLKSDYRYSAKLVYNNFPWPEISDKKPIEKLAQAILDAREEEFTKDTETSLADLYDPNFMPTKLRKAHKALDRAVDKLYDKNGFKAPLDRVKHLFGLYQLKLNT
jgi:hypothetical protein